LANENSGAAKKMLHPSYRADIDGLRAIAVSLVVCFHYFPNRLPGGFIGVDVFFVISGFLISTIIFKNLEAGAFALADFYLRRQRRIFPALAIVLFATLAAGYFLLLADEYSLLGKHTALAAIFCANFGLWSESGYFDRAADLKPLLHLWSLGIEEQFYLAWPMLLIWVWKRKFSFFTTAFFVAIASFLINVVTVHSNPVAAFYSPLSRFWELMLGGMLAYVILHRPALAALRADILSWCGLGMIAICGWFLTKEDAFPGWWALLATTGACLIIAAGPQGWVNRWILSSSAFVFVGLISYPLYLWHWPLLSIATIVSEATPSLGIRLVLLGFAVLLATFTYFLIERPVRTNRNHFRAAMACSAAVAVIGIAGFAIFETDGIEWRTIRGNPAWFDFGLNDDRVAACLLGESERPPLSSSCDTSLGSSHETVVIWGDSHANSLALGLSQKGRTDNFNLAIYTASGCPPILGFVNDARPWCVEENELVAKKIQQYRPRTVFLSAFWFLYNGHMGWNLLDLEKLRDTITFLRESGVKQIVLVGEFPLFLTAQPRIGVYHFVKNRIDRTLHAIDPVAEPTDQKMRSFAAEMGIAFVSPIEIFCNLDGCLLSARRDALVPTAWDYGHLTRAGALYLIDEAIQRSIFILSPSLSR
jgi:peptidoglycan/LPS O-acetylase OafA/YrhL